MRLPWPAIFVIEDFAPLTRLDQPSRHITARGLLLPQDYLTHGCQYHHRPTVKRFPTELFSGIEAKGKKPTYSIFPPGLHVKGIEPSRQEIQSCLLTTSPIVHRFYYLNNNNTLTLLVVMDEM